MRQNMNEIITKAIHCEYIVITLMQSNVLEVADRDVVASHCLLQEVTKYLNVGYIFTMSIPMSH